MENGDAEQDGLANTQAIVGLGSAFHADLSHRL
jgi:hypothetical protein